MGFFDNLQRNNVFNLSALNQVEPLFGGLIPRREVFMPEQRIIQEQESFNPIIRPMPRKGGLERAAEAFSEQQQPLNFNPPRYPDEERKLAREQLAAELELGRGKLGLERNKFGYEQLQDFKEFGLKSELGRENINIGRRKQALDEWKSRNPEGDIKVDENGKIVVINKLTGKIIDTGLKSEHFSEEEKQKRDFLGREKLEKVKGEQERLTADIKREPDRISPATQRTAEDDAASELLRDKKYSWLVDKEYVTVDKDGIHINRPTGGGGMFGQASVDQIKDSNLVIDQFEKDIKTKATERLNRTFDTKPAIDNNMVGMLTPDGRPMKVPKEDVEKMTKLGAKLKV